MRRKVVVGFLLVLGVIVVSQTAAQAATCLSWKTIGGSSMCVSWATKGVQVAVAFKDGCFAPAIEGPGQVQDCQVVASSSGTDSIVFCGDPNHPTRVTCNNFFTFGPTALGADTPNFNCVEHPDNESDNGDNNEHHRCVSTATLDPAGSVAAGTACCSAAGAGAFLDLTPIEMMTDIEASYLGGGNEVPPCTPGAPFCNVQQDCTINPKKIAFITDPSLGKDYQCNTTCTGFGCGE